MRAHVVRPQPERSATASIQIVFTTDAVFASGVPDEVALRNRQPCPHRPQSSGLCALASPKGVGKAL